jgi:hypothetical protein
VHSMNFRREVAMFVSHYWTTWYCELVRTR